MKIYYDLHIHSALSPCGDDEMTPNNIVNMAFGNNLNVIGITDHNSCKNAKSVLTVADKEKFDILIIPGMEICTTEEVHCICLFDSIAGAMEFDEFVYSKMPNIKNSSEIFGKQQIIDSFDNEIGVEEKLLINACDISINQLVPLTEKYNGICYPAHINKQSNSILSNLGFFPDDCGFNAFEITEKSLINPLLTMNPILSELNSITSSDAHYFWDIKDNKGENFFDIKGCDSIKELTIRDILNEIIFMKKRR